MISIDKHGKLKKIILEGKQKNIIEQH